MGTDSTPRSEVGDVEAEFSRLCDYAANEVLRVKSHDGADPTAQILVRQLVQATALYAGLMVVDMGLGTWPSPVVGTSLGTWDRTVMLSWHGDGGHLEVEWKWDTEKERMVAEVFSYPGHFAFESHDVRLRDFEEGPGWMWALCQYVSARGRELYGGA